MPAPTEVTDVAIIGDRPSGCSRSSSRHLRCAARPRRLDVGPRAMRRALPGEADLDSPGHPASTPPDLIQHSRFKAAPFRPVLSPAQQSTGGNGATAAGCWRPPPATASRDVLISRPSSARRPHPAALPRHRSARRTRRLTYWSSGARSSAQECVIAGAAFFFLLGVSPGRGAASVQVIPRRPKFPRRAESTQRLADPAAAADRAGGALSSSGFGGRGWPAVPVIVITLGRRRSGRLPPTCCCPSSACDESGRIAGWGVALYTACRCRPLRPSPPACRSSHRDIAPYPGKLKLILSASPSRRLGRRLHPLVSSRLGAALSILDHPGVPGV